MASPVIQKRTVETATEQRILTGLIVSSKFIREIQDAINLGYFQSSYIKKVARWTLDYFDEYETAPFEHIQDIFNSKSYELDPSELEVVEQLLTNISERYQQEGGINEQYLTDQAIKYFKKRELEIRQHNINVLLLQDNVEEAEAELQGYKKIGKVLSGWVDPFEDKEIEEVFDAMDDTFLTFPGQLGEFMGNLQREWLVAVMAPFKRGKTWFLQEFAIMAALLEWKVAVFYLEGTPISLKERIYKRLTSGYKRGGRARFPVFDCIHNQTGECELPYRTNQIALYDEHGRLPPFESNMEYSPCVACRDRNGDYTIATWFEELERPPFDYVEVRKMKNLLDRNLRIKPYPRFSANTSHIKRDLDNLEYREDFIADVIIIDYAGILLPEDSRITGVERVDETWKSLGRLAGERRAQVVTASQVTRRAMEKAKVKGSETAQWIGILAHVDAMFSMNQTPEEKRKGVMRIGKIAHRHEDFDTDQDCYVLQALELGQFHLDSQIAF